MFPRNFQDGGRQKKLRKNFYDFWEIVHPVRLKCGQSDKLLFPLCRTCAITQQQEKCNHTNDDRAFTGTWCSNEIALALKKGYRILDIYEVWHFDKTTDTLFKGYVRHFMKLKIGTPCVHVSAKQSGREVKAT